MTGPNRVQAVAVKLTANDKRVLLAAEKACETWDGFMPHGIADWTAIRRLQEHVFVEQSEEYHDCQTCPVSHEGSAYRLTIWAQHFLADERDAKGVGHG